MGRGHQLRNLSDQSASLNHQSGTKSNLTTSLASSNEQRINLLNLWFMYRWNVKEFWKPMKKNYLKMSNDQLEKNVIHILYSYDGNFTQTSSD